MSYLLSSTVCSSWGSFSLFRFLCVVCLLLCCISISFSIRFVRVTVVCSFSFWNAIVLFETYYCWHQNEMCQSIYITITILQCVIFIRYFSHKDVHHLIEFGRYYRQTSVIFAFGLDFYTFSLNKDSVGSQLLMWFRYTSPPWESSRQKGKPWWYIT